MVNCIFFSTVAPLSSPFSSSTVASLMTGESLHPFFLYVFGLCLKRVLRAFGSDGLRTVFVDDEPGYVECSEVVSFNEGGT